MPLFKAAVLAVLAFIHLSALAATSGSKPELMRPDNAFQYQVSDDAGELVIDWTVVPGYYLYKQKLSFALEDAPALAESPLLPRGTLHSDEFFGEQEIYESDFQVRLPYTANGAGNATLVIKTQGCSSALGICFPPQTWRTAVTLTAGGPLAGLSTGGALGGLSSSDNANEFLPPDEAFEPLITELAGNTVEVGWQIAPGYYLYKGQVQARFADADGVVVTDVSLPEGKLKSDEYFGETEVYYDGVFATLALARESAAAQPATLTLSYQGCAEEGICYPMIERQFNISLPNGEATDLAAVTAAAPLAAPSTGSESAAPVSEQARLAALISSGNLFLVLGTFFVAGLVLSLTPCVLPMVPILSGIIAGEGDNVTPMRGFTLALIYVLGMALTYTIAGAAFAAVGQQAQTTFQQPWILITFAGLFVVLAASMFGAFELQMPSSIQTRLAAISGNQKSGTAVGAFIMGALSSLVVTACVAPPLVAALAVIGQTGDVVRGALALFALSIGMGTPLLVVGASAGRLLPKAGAWMVTVKQAFGFIMLGLAIWMLARLLPEGITLLLWAVLIFVAGVFLGALTPLTQDAGAPQRVGKGFALLATFYGAVLFIGALTGGQDPLQPLKGSVLEARVAAGSDTTQEKLSFQTIKTVAELDGAIASAAREGRGVMLDFYADWCVSCKEMEKYTFTDGDVMSVLSNTVLLKADVTANDSEDQALLRRFEIFGPPSIIFFGPDGVERPGYQVVGFMKPAKFAPHARAAIAATGTTAFNR
ncbi:MAG: protein-disulfide reductase DsbD [Pseudomonadota bacterium]